MTDYKKQFAGLHIPEPSAGFEERIIARALTQNSQRFAFRKLAIAAAFVLVLFTAVVTNLRTEQTPYDAYAAIYDSDVLSTADVYDDLVLAYGY